MNKVYFSTETARADPMSEDEDFTALDSDDDMDESSTNFGFVKFCFSQCTCVTFKRSWKMVYVRLLCTNGSRPLNCKQRTSEFLKKVVDTLLEGGIIIYDDLFSTKACLIAMKKSTTRYPELISCRYLWRMYE